MFLHNFIDKDAVIYKISLYDSFCFFSFVALLLDR